MALGGAPLQLHPHILQASSRCLELGIEFLTSRFFSGRWKPGTHGVKEWRTPPGRVRTLGLGRR